MDSSTKTGLILRSEITPFGVATLAYRDGVLVTERLWYGGTIVYIPPKLPLDDAHRYLKDKYANW